MHAKMWSSKKLLPLQISGHFTGNFVGRLWESLGVSEGKIMERCIAKTFSKWNNSTQNKYVMYFHLVTYFLIALVYLSVRFLRISIKKNCTTEHVRFFPQEMADALYSCDILMM